MMTAATLDSTANFSMSPLARAAGAHLRPATGMVHGTDAEGAAKGITLAEAKRIAFEAAERVWRASSDAFKSFLEMLLNLLRWISRPFRNGPAPTQAAGTGESVGTSGTPKGDPNGLLSPSEIAAEHNVSKIPGETGVASFAARSGTTGSDLVPVEPATIEAVVESVAKKIPNLEDADPRVLTLATTSSLLDQHATRLLELKARAQEIGEAMNAEVAALARAQGRNPDAVLNLVLSDPEEGGDQGNEIRRLF